MTEEKKTKTQKKANDHSRFDDDVMTRAIDLYCDGVKKYKIAEMLGISRTKIDAWIKKKKPVDWEKERAKRATLKLKILEKRSLELYENTQQRHQTWLAAAGSNVAQALITAAKEGRMSGAEAAEALIAIIREEVALYAPLADRIAAQGGPKMSAMIGISGGVQQGEAMGGPKFVAMLSAEWERRNAQKPSVDVPVIDLENGSTSTDETD